MRKVRRDHHRTRWARVQKGGGKVGRRSGAMAKEAEEEESNVQLLLLAAVVGSD